jgi:hypothetical protein
MGDVKVSSSCKKELPNKYMKLFVNKTSTATYIAFDRGKGGERDGRFLIYGVPSSFVFKECDSITKEAQKKYSGRIYCVQGTVG